MENNLKKISHRFASHTLSCLCVVVTLSGCGARSGTQPDNSAAARGEEFTRMVANGRKVPYQHFAPRSPGLTLAYLIDNPSVSTLLDDNGSKYLGFESYDVTRMPALDEADLETYAFGLLAEKGPAMGLEISELTKAARFVTLVSDKLLALTFNRSYQGVPVRDARVQLFFNRNQDGSLVLRELVNRSFGPIVLANDETQPADEADISSLTSIDNFTTLHSERLILPRETAQGGYQFYLAKAFKIRDESSGEAYIVTLADGPAQLLEAYTPKVSATTESTLMGAVYERSYVGAIANRPMINTTMTLGGSQVVTNLDGNFAYPGAQSGTFALSNGRDTVYDENKNLVTMSLSLLDDAQQIVTPSAPDMIKLNPFLAVQRENQFVRHHLTTTQVPFLGQEIRINVNTEGVCNSYFNPDDKSLNLFKQGAQNGKTCANTALVNDVIYHEWGHALDNGTGNGISDGAFSEGIGDTLSGFITNDSNLGIGFFLNTTTPIRLLKNTKSYPADKGEVHDEGQIISGAFWDLHEALVARYGAIRGAYKAEEMFLKHLLTTNTYTDSYQAVLRLDDGSSNPSVNSANHCTINKAFAAHGLATAENCQDPALQENLPIDSKIVLAVQSEATDGVIFMAAAEDTAYSAVLCLKDRTECDANDSTNIAMSLDGAKNSLHIFLASTKVKITDQQLVTLIVKDKDQKVIGARTMKFAAK